MVCCFCPSSPTESGTDRYGNYIRTTGTPFQTDMVHAPCSDCPYSCCWFSGQFFGIGMICTQIMLRRKALNYDMSKYRCFQGQFVICGAFRANNCWETSCPNFCLCMEATCCNGPAVSATRGLVMDRYDLVADPCDNQLMHCSNALQVLSICCYVAAMFDESFYDLAVIVDYVATLVYHTVSGCMTAQTNTEMNYQVAKGNAEGSGYYNRQDHLKNDPNVIYASDAARQDREAAAAQQQANPANIPVATAVPVGGRGYGGGYGGYPDGLDK